MKAWNHVNPQEISYFILHLSDDDAARLLEQLQETIRRRNRLVEAAPELRNVSHTVWVAPAQIDGQPSRISFSIAAE